MSPQQLQKSWNDLWPFVKRAAPNAHYSEARVCAWFSSGQLDLTGRRMKPACKRLLSTALERGACLRPAWLRGHLRRGGQGRFGCAFAGKVRGCQCLGISEVLKKLEKHIDMAR